jgi:hypothetical protein
MASRKSKLTPEQLGSLGGIARAKSLSKKRRVEIARNAGKLGGRPRSKAAKKKLAAKLSS